MSSPGFYNPSLALVDFRSALDHCGRCRPVYPERKWWYCLERANQSDISRMLVAHYAKIDASQYSGRRVVYRAWLGSTSSGKMNGTVLHLAACEPEVWRSSESSRA